MMECPLAIYTHDEEKHENTSPRPSFIGFHTSPSVLPESRSEACGTQVPGSLPVVCAPPRRPAPQWAVRAGVTPSSARPAAPRGGALQQPANFNWQRWEFQTVLSQLSSSSFWNRLIPIIPISGLPPCVPAKPPAPHLPWLGLSGMAARSAAADWSPCHVASETNDAPGWADDQGNVAMSGPNSKLSSEVVQDWGQSLEIYNSAPTSLHLK